MTHLQEDFLQLLSLTQMHLLQEYEKGAWVFADQSVYKSFKAYAQENNLKKKTTVPQKNETQTPKNIMQPASPKKPALTSPENKRKEVSQDSPKIEIPREETKTSVEQKLSFERHLPQATSADDFQHVRKIVNKLFPNQKIHEEAFDEKNPKELDSLEIIVLMDDAGLQESFFKNLVKAIQISLCSSSGLCSSTKELDALISSRNLKMVIGQNNNLEKIQSDQIDKVKFPISPVEVYLQDPIKKADLWKMICAEYKNRSK
jgi:hypothetical protein